MTTQRPMSGDEALALMRARGYTVMSQAADRSQYVLTKEVLGFVVGAVIAAPWHNVTLEYIGKRWLQVSTGPFSVQHSEFIRYETHIAHAATALAIYGA